MVDLWRWLCWLFSGGHQARVLGGVADGELSGCGRKMGEEEEDEEKEKENRGAVRWERRRKMERKRRIGGGGR